MQNLFNELYESEGGKYLGKFDIELGKYYKGLLGC